MSEVTDTCAKIELNNLVLKKNAQPCATTPVCEILSKTKREMETPKEKWSRCECHSLGLPVEV